MCVCVWAFCITPRFGSRLRIGSGGELNLAALAVLAGAPLAAVGANGGAPAILAVASDAVMLEDARARHTCVSPQAYFVLSRIGLREQGKGWSDGGLGVLKSESLPGSSRRDYFQRRQASSRRWCARSEGAYAGGDVGGAIDISGGDGSRAPATECELHDVGEAHAGVIGGGAAAKTLCAEN